MDKPLWDRTGDVGGLEGLIRPSSYLGGPEKKKRKSTVQISSCSACTTFSLSPARGPGIGSCAGQAPLPLLSLVKTAEDCPLQSGAGVGREHCSIQGSMLPPLSEYAPPTITSSDHLIASNPFDDGHSISPLSGYTYFGKPRYINNEPFNTFKMPPNTSPKRSYRNGGSQSYRDQPLSFPKEVRHMSLGRTLSFSNIQEKSPFENDSYFNSGLGQTIAMPGQHFRPIHDQDVFHITSLNSGQRNNVEPSNYRAQSGKMHFIQHLVGSPQFEASQPHFMPPKMSSHRQESDVASNKSNLNLIAIEENSHPGDFSQHTTNPHDSKNHRHTSDHFQSETIDLTNCGPGNGVHSKTSLPKLSKSGVTPSEKCNRWLLQSSFSGSLPSDTMYPCGICSIEVTNIGDAIMCEVSCRKWFHRACTGMTEIAYAMLTAETSAIWGCDTCMAKKDVQLVCVQK